MRRFVCAPADIERFIAECVGMCDKLGHYSELERYHYLKRSTVDWYIGRLHRYSIPLDPETEHCHKAWVMSHNLVDFHYLLHNLILQTVEGHKAGKLVLDDETLFQYVRITEECLS